MSKARNIADLLDANGDVEVAALGNVPPSNDASALTTGTLDIARLAANSITAAKLTDSYLTGIADGSITETKLASGAVTEAKVASNAVTSAKINNGAVTKAKIETQSQFPAGTVAYFPMSSAPTGWLKCNGSTISRSSYPDLFAAIGTAYGAGNGSTTFRIPDYRGEFIRSWDDSRGIDFTTTSQISRALNSYQKGSVNAWNQPATEGYYGYMAAGGTNDIREGQDILGYDYAHDSYSGSQTGHDSAGPVNSSNWWQASGWGAGTTRPRNFALLACIKY